MGVPHLLGYFARRCPGSIHVVDAACASLPGDPVSELHVDFNTVVHGCVRDVYDRAKGGGIDEDAIVEACVSHLRRLLAVVRPSELLYVAVDGVPPRAKMQQQRFRRFMAVHMEDRLPWDTNAITPGTEFMARLCAGLERFAAEEAPRVVVSGSDEPGEGEQKIFQRLRRAQRGGATRRVVYGLDADLLLMSMALGAPDVWVLREQELRGPLQLVHPNAVSRCMCAQLQKECGVRVDVEEFVGLMGLAGNDFVPSLPGLSIRAGGVDELIRAYGRVAARGGSLVRGGPAALGGFDPTVLRDVVAELSSTEAGSVGRALQAVSERRPQTHSRRPKPMPMPMPMPMPRMQLSDRSLQQQQQQQQQHIDPAAAGWRPRYYRAAFGDWSHALVRRVCADYVASLAWSAAYMTRQTCMSQGWFYPHAHAPTALDLHHALVGDVGALSTALARGFDAADEAHMAHMGVVDAQTWQLMLVLPPQSAHLLDACGAARDIVRGSVLPCAHMYPTRFSLSTMMCDRLHMCTPRLPAIDTFALVDCLST